MARRKKTTRVWKAYLAGFRQDVALRNYLVKRYYGLVRSILRELSTFLPPFVDFDSLRQCGSIGLLQSVERFNPQHGCTFSTFASPRIRGAILDELRRQDFLPRLARTRSTLREKIESNLAHVLGRFPTEEETANESGWSNETIRKSQPIKVGSLDEAIGENDSGKQIALNDILESPKGSARYSKNQFFVRTTRGLDFESRVALYLCFLCEHTMEETGEAMLINASRVSQLVARGMEFVRKNRDKVEAWEELAEVQQHGGEEVAE
jgi:RNA polymerase sigma factor for flagellar operon FliA